MTTSEPGPTTSSAPVLAKVVGYREAISRLWNVMIATEIVAVVGVVAGVVFSFHTRQAATGNVHPDRAVGVSLIIVSVLFGLVAGAIYCAATAIIGD